MQPVHSMEVEDKIVKIKKEGNLPVLPSGKIMNLTEDDMDVLRCIVITIDCGNDTSPDHIPEQKYQQQGRGQ